MSERNPFALAVAGMLAMAGALGIGRFVYTPILPSMMADLGWSAADAGFVASANYLGYLGGAIGAAQQKIAIQHQRHWFLGALGISALSTTAVALATDLTTFHLLRFVGGAASAYVIVLGSTLVLERLAQEDRAQLSQVHFAGVGVGIVLTAVLVAALSAGGFDWRAQWLVAGLMALAATIGVAWLVGQSGNAASAAAERSGDRDGDELFGLPFLTFAYGLFGFGYIITATFIVVMVRGSPVLAVVEPWVWAAFGLAAIPSVALWVWVARRMGLMAALAMACVVEAIGVALSVMMVSPAGILFSAILLGGTFMGITALGLVAARTMAGSRTQRALGWMTASFALGQMIGPLVAGLFIEASGSFRSATLIAAGALLVAGALVILAGWDRRQMPA